MHSSTQETTIASFEKKTLGEACQLFLGQVGQEYRKALGKTIRWKTILLAAVLYLCFLFLREGYVSDP